MYIVSACLLGEDCKYSGGNNYSEKTVVFLKGRSYTTVCPELTGGLPVPRAPVELQGFTGETTEQGIHVRRAVNKDGGDVTKEFYDGARLEWDRLSRLAEETGDPIEGAILRRGSPTCGSGRIYDGTFNGKMIPGDGVFAELLKSKGIKVKTEEEL